TAPFSLPKLLRGIQNAPDATPSPPAAEHSARHTVTSIVSPTKCVEASQQLTFTPPLCLLRAAKYWLLTELLSVPPAHWHGGTPSNAAVGIGVCSVHPLVVPSGNVQATRNALSPLTSLGVRVPSKVCPP